jgi:predicted hydrocarbon binding protein
MADRNKDVMVYRYDPKKKYFIVSLHLENKPGALGNLANLLGIRGINILEGYFGGITYGSQGNMSFFLETTNQQMDEGWLKDFLTPSVYVSDVVVKSATEGFLTDSVNFPVTWNSGDRAVLMRVGALRAMLDATRALDPATGDASIYAQGFGYGKTAWEDLLSRHRPKTKEGLAEMLQIFNATGWGKIELTDLNVHEKKAKVKLTEGFECAEKSTGRTEGHFIAGVLAGAFSAYFGTDVRTTETKCTSKADPRCEFEVSP